MTVNRAATRDLDPAEQPTRAAWIEIRLDPATFGNDVRPGRGYRLRRCLADLAIALAAAGVTAAVGHWRRQTRAGKPAFDEPA